jgi:uncharacterized protein (DUF433 family)
MAERVEQVSIVDPAIVAERLRLANLAQAEAARMRSTPLAPYQVAGLSPGFQQATQLSQQGVGSYAPFLQAATSGLDQAAGALGAGVGTLQQGLGALQRFPTAYAPLGDAANAASLAQQQAQQAISGAAGSTNLAQQQLAQASMSPEAARAQADMLAQQSRLGQFGQQAQAGILGAVAPAQDLANLAQFGMSQAQFGQTEAQQAMAMAGGDTGRALQMLQAQGVNLNQLPADVRQNLLSSMAPAEALTGFGQAGMSQAQIGQMQAQEAIARGRDIAGAAAGQLLGAGQMYDPSMAQGFMDPYRRDVVEAQQQEMQRLADIQRQGIRAQAVGAGAFGGSREAVQQSELTRNLMDQQARISAELMSQGYTQAQAQSQAAFEAAQQRQLSGAGQAGQIGLSAEQLAAQTGLAGGQLGLAGLQQASANAAQLAQMGMSAEQIAAQTGLTAQQLAQQGIVSQGQLAQSMGQMQAQTGLASGQLGLAGTQQAAANVAQLAQLGLSAQQIAAQTGLSVEQVRQATSLASGQLGLSQAQLAQQGALSAGQLGQQMGQIGIAGGQLGMTQADLLRQLGLSTGMLASQEADIARNLGLGIGSLGSEMGQLSMSQAQLGQIQSGLLGTDVQRMAALAEMEREQQQRVLDAQRSTAMQDYLRPFQEVGFQSDIYSGIPTSQSLIQASAGQQPSTAQQLIGTGISALSGLASAQKSGLF